MSGGGALHMKKDIIKVIIYVIFTIIGVYMILHTTKQYADKEGHKRYVDRLDYTIYQVSMMIIGAIISSIFFIFILIKLWVL